IVLGNSPSEGSRKFGGVGGDWASTRDWGDQPEATISKNRRILGAAATCGRHTSAVPIMFLVATAASRRTSYRLYPSTDWLFRHGGARLCCDVRRSLGSASDVNRGSLHGSVC